MSEEQETDRDIAGLLTAVAVFLLAVSGGAWLFMDDVPPETAVVETSEPQPEPALSPEVMPVPQIDAAQNITPPVIDEIRREEDGITVIAGRAEPGSKVSVRVDGTEIASTRADSGGGFAIVSLVPPSEEAQVMTLVSQGEGDSVTSDDEILLAPVAPEAVVPAPAVPLEDVTTADGVSQPTPQDQEPTAQSVETVDTPQTQTFDPPTPEAAEEPKQQVAILKSDAEGVTLLQSAQPQAMTNVAIDTIGYSDVGEVQLAGRAQRQATEVRVYLDNDAVISLPVDDQGRWRGDLPDVDEGVYILRIDEVTADGTVSSRVETPFKRESADVLAAAARLARGKISAVTVQEGATLWAIARDRYGDGLLYVKVFQANNEAIRDPDLIYPGQVFSLPD